MRILNTSFIAFIITIVGCAERPGAGKSHSSDNFLIEPPKQGYVTQRQAAKWEEAMLTGNGTIGALVIGDPLSDRLILSHEKLFMPQYPPYPAPDLGSRLERIRSLILAGKNQDAVDLLIQAGQEVGIDDMIWTDPLVPACQLEIVTSERKIDNYTRGVNYETGEAMVAWQAGDNVFERRVFTSRVDDALVLKISSPTASTITTKMRLTQLPVDMEDNDEEQEFGYDQVVDVVKAGVEEDGKLRYVTKFKKKWEGSLKGFVVETQVKLSGGTLRSDGEWLHIEDANTITAYTKILLSYDLPVAIETDVSRFTGRYEDLLDGHGSVHGEMFNRFALTLSNNDTYLPPEELLQASSVGNLNNKLVEELCKSARYTLISSTGEIPPTLQGIWGGTWLPAWSGDFTLNGNVPSAIASGLNTNFQEVTEAYMSYMYSMFEEFKANAKGLYGAPGIFVPSRSSSFGSTYHYGDYYPHLFWFAGNSWTSQFFYDYWQYTGDEDFLREKVIPFMLASMEFYEFILARGEDGQYMFIPSYSPEVGPIDTHPLAINATMDIAGLKQLIRNLLTLENQGYLKTEKVANWMEILDNLPAYEIDEDGDLKEWIWPGYQNDNAHRHASHLYPLFYEVDPEFKDRPELIQAAKTTIEKRMEYRRVKNGAEMAFGLVQKGLAAAHIGDMEHAYECVDYLCNSYWSPAFTSYHDPGEIFNVDISGGLPALVAEMIIQSSKDQITLLPALPGEWPAGEIKGVRTRCGATIDLVWELGKPKSAKIRADRDTKFKLVFRERTWDIVLAEGQSMDWENQ